MDNVVNQKLQDLLVDAGQDLTIVDTHNTGMRPDFLQLKVMTAIGKSLLIIASLLMQTAVGQTVPEEWKQR